MSHDPQHRANTGSQIKEKRLKDDPEVDARRSWGSAPLGGVSDQMCNFMSSSLVCVVSKKNIKQEVTLSPALFSEGTWLVWDSDITEVLHKCPLLWSIFMNMNQWRSSGPNMCRVVYSRLAKQCLFHKYYLPQRGDDEHVAKWIRLMFNETSARGSQRAEHCVAGRGWELSCHLPALLLCL